jgi:PAS domain-containing protein
MSELLAEVISTRIAAIENYVHAQVDVMVRRLELRLIEAASTEGDWRYALFRNPRTLLQPLEATGAALFWGGETLTVGDVPSTRELRALEQWVSEQTDKSAFVCSSIERANPELRSLTPIASGVLAIELSPSRPDYLMWFRKEQLCTVKWAGNPAKPMLDNDPLQLSPRRSFATWSEIVRGTATPWSRAEVAIARAIGDALVDIILQIHTVRLLIAQHQVTQVRKEIESSKEPVVIADAHGRILFSNEAFARLFQKPHVHLDRLEDISALFTEPLQVRGMLNRLKTEHEAWRGELGLVALGRDSLPVGVRADVIPGPDEVTLGFVVILTDISELKTAEAARRRFEQSLAPASHNDAALDAGSSPIRDPDEVVGAILANANVAAMEIADAGDGGSVASLLEELEASTRRAAALYQQLRDYTGRG